MRGRAAPSHPGIYRVPPGGVRGGGEATRSFLLSLPRPASVSSPAPNYTPGWREGLVQEHNTMSPARACSRTARSGDERTSHEATAPPTINTIWHLIVCGVLWRKEIGENVDTRYQSSAWLLIAFDIGDCQPITGIEAH